MMAICQTNFFQFTFPNPQTLCPPNVPLGPLLWYISVIRNAIPHSLSLGLLYKQLGRAICQGVYRILVKPLY